MTPQQTAALDVQLLERWYRLASPPVVAPPATDAVSVFGVCLACVVLVLIAQAHGA